MGFVTETTRSEGWTIESRSDKWDTAYRVTEWQDSNLIWENPNITAWNTESFITINTWAYPDTTWGNTTSKWQSLT